MGTKLFMICMYLQAMWNTLIIPCVTVPENWKYCTKDLDVWLFPELVRGWEALQGDLCLYCEEKEKLNDLGTD